MWITPVFLAVATVLAPQWDTSCQGPNPRLERVSEAIRTGDIGTVREHLNSSADVNEAWRDRWAPMLCRTMLHRSVYWGNEDIFRLLLERHADPLSVPSWALQIPVRDGRVEMVRTLLALGVRPNNNAEIVVAGLESKNLAMLDLLVSSGFTMNASNVPVYYLTDEITRFLVPKHLGANDDASVGGEEPCDVEKLFGVFSKNQDGCEGAVGPLWMHFVFRRNHEIVQFMIKNGADLSVRATVSGLKGTKSFTGPELAAKRNDKRMVDLLKRAGASTR
jgi:ankyrin repeat protein